MAADLMSMFQNMAPRSNRSLDDLKNSTEQLSGADAQALRTFAYQSPMVPSRDLTDPLGKALLSQFYEGIPDALPKYVDERLATLEGDRAALAKELYEKRWGPTRVPIFNVVLQFFYYHPKSKQKLLDSTRYLAHELEVPVDGADITGSSALFWAVSTKPYAEPEFAQILFDAGGSVNQRNRFGVTAALEIAQVDITGDTKKSVNMMKWFVEHGGDVNGKDNDGVSVKRVVGLMRGRVPGLAAALEKGKGLRREGECANCGRRPNEGTSFSACGRCKAKRYCSQGCQKIDWRTYKTNCKAPP